MRIPALAVVAVLLAGSAYGQCRPAEAWRILDVGNVRTLVVNDGGLFYRPGLQEQQPFLFEVPKGSGVDAIFAGSFWLGGQVGRQVRVAASTYSRREFWPGPIQESPPDSLGCSDYDRVFEITRDDLELLNSRQVLTPNVLDWPWELGAPVIDGDGNPDNYDPLAGDRPALRGHQMLWWLMNDAAGTHESSGSPPLGVEIGASAFSYDVSGDVGNTVFYSFELSARQRITDTYAGLWVDADLGVFHDDYHASDTLLHLGYFYNADEDDEVSRGGYGSPPPAVGGVFLGGPPSAHNGRDDNRDGSIDEAGERLGMSSFVCGRKGRGPRSAEEFYNNLRGLRIDGTPIYVGGDFGSNDFSNVPVRFCYPGRAERGEFWSPEDIDGQGTKLTPRDLRFVMNMGPFVLEPGASETIDFAFVWSRGSDRLDSVRKLKETTRHLHEVRDALLMPSVRHGEGDYAPPDPESPLVFMQNYPNPASDETIIQLSVPRPADVRLEVIDVLGRTVAALLDGPQDAGSKRVRLDTSTLPPGIYLYRYRMDHWTFTKRMTVVR